jgi:RNA polymerase sigma factor (TIGR02999 family)
MARFAESEVTQLLNRAGDGDDAAFRAVFELVYEELHRLAHHVRRGRGSETLNTTALVHEAYLHLLPSQGLEWKNRGHFLAVAARAMRQVLVRAAERRNAQKRGGGQVAVEFEDALHAGDGSPGATPERVIALDEALRRLEGFAPRQARVVECRFFAGLGVEDTALALDISEPTVKRDWRTARAWLAREMEQ